MLKCGQVQTRANYAQRKNIRQKGSINDGRFQPENQTSRRASENCCLGILRRGGHGSCYQLRIRQPFHYAGRRLVGDRLHHWSTGSQVRVGIIDTPIDASHPDLEPTVVSQQYFLDGKFDAMDLVHGTAVAGIIGAAANNGIGIVGFAPDVELHGYAACHHDSSKGHVSCNTFTLAKALVAAALDRAQVVNLSVAGPEDALLTRLIKALVSRGIVVVASANADHPDLSFPASMASVLGVGTRNTDRSDAILRVMDEHLSTVPGGGWRFFYGSSMSTAKVTGLVALLLEREPDMNTGQIFNLFQNLEDRCQEDSGNDFCLMTFALRDAMRLN